MVRRPVIRSSEREAEHEQVDRETVVVFIDRIDVARLRPDDLPDTERIEVHVLARIIPQEDAPVFIFPVCTVQPGLQATIADTKLVGATRPWNRDL